MSDVYVSSSTGNDKNAGTQSAPLKSLAAAGKKKASAVYLRAGDTFAEAVPAASADGYLVASYGNGPRPVIQSPAEGFNQIKRANVTVRGLHFKPTAGNAGKYNGVRLVWCRNVTVDDCLVENHKFGATCEGDDKTRSSGFKLTNSIIRDNWDSQKSMASGLFASYTDSITLDGNVFDHNGWSATIPANIFSHNAYIHASNTGLLVNANVFANASSHGIQCRCGGTVTGNFFWNNAIHQSFGLVNGLQNHHVPGGVTGGITGNVYVGGRDIAGDPRGTGVEIANVKQAVVLNNLFANDTQKGAHGAIEISQGNAPGDVGILDLKLSGNVISAWPKGVWVNPKAYRQKLVLQDAYNVAASTTTKTTAPCKCCGQPVAGVTVTAGADTSFTLPADWIAKARDRTAGYSATSAVAAYQKAFGMVPA